MALTFDLDSYTANSYGFHNFHPYPAKYIPQIPRKLIDTFSSVGEWVLDPFCGSGTTLVEALDAGRHAVGVDVNPLACLISRVKTAPLSAIDVDEVHRVLAASELIHMQASTPRWIPTITNLHKWFRPDMFRELAALRSIIDSCASSTARDFLLVAFSAIIIKVSNQESDTRYRAIEKDLSPGDAARAFIQKARDMLNRSLQFFKAHGCQAQVFNCDSTSTCALPQPIDLVVTSPPYLNSFDYYLYHKHRLAWLGFDHYEVQRLEFGSRNKHNDNGLAPEAYFDSIGTHVRSLKPVLRSGAKYACVVGDGIVRGEFIKMDEAFDHIFAEEGFVKVDQFNYAQRAYTKTFTPKLRTQPKETYILIYELN